MERPTINRAEQFELTLTLLGRYAGTQEWFVQAERGSLSARVQTDFGGVLPQVRRVQHSRMHPQLLTSLQYTEGDGRGRPSFETHFDHRAGVVTLRQGKDTASAPLLTPYYDPVSLILWLRQQDDPPTTVQLTGGKVRIQRLTDTEIEGQTCRVYVLRPGGAYVYIEETTRRIMRMIQPTDFGAVEANLGAQLARKSQPERRRRRATH